LFILSHRRNVTARREEELPVVGAQLSVISCKFSGKDAK
jgi:hypothetical protein